MKYFNASACFSCQNRTSFVGLTPEGAAVFFNPNGFNSNEEAARIAPPDGPGTFRADEKLCATRLKNTLQDSGEFAKQFPEQYELDVANSRAALIAIQKWKKERGIELETPDVLNTERRGIGTALTAK